MQDLNKRSEHLADGEQKLKQTLRRMRPENGFEAGARGDAAGKAGGPEGSLASSGSSASLLGARGGSGGGCATEELTAEDAKTLDDILQIQRWLLSIKQQPATFRALRGKISEIKRDIYKPPQASGFGSTTEMRLADHSSDDEFGTVDIDELEERAGGNGYEQFAAATAAAGGAGDNDEVPEGVTFENGVWKHSGERDADDDAYALDDLSDDSDGEEVSRNSASTNSTGSAAAGAGGGAGTDGDGGGDELRTGPSGRALHEFEIGDDTVAAWRRAAERHKSEYGGCFGGASIASRVLDGDTALSRRIEIDFLLHQARVFASVADE